MSPSFLHSSTRHRWEERENPYALVLHVDLVTACTPILIFPTITFPESFLRPQNPLN